MLHSLVRFTSAEVRPHYKRILIVQTRSPGKPVNTTHRDEGIVHIKGINQIESNGDLMGVEKIRKERDG